MLEAGINTSRYLPLPYLEVLITGQKKPELDLIWFILLLSFLFSMSTFLPNRYFSFYILSISHRYCLWISIFVVHILFWMYRMNNFFKFITIWFFILLNYCTSAASILAFRLCSNGKGWSCVIGMFRSWVKLVNNFRKGFTESIPFLKKHCKDLMPIHLVAVFIFVPFRFMFRSLCLLIFWIFLKINIFLVRTLSRKLVHVFILFFKHSTSEKILFGVISIFHVK